MNNLVTCTTASEMHLSQHKLHRTVQYLQNEDCYSLAGTSSTCQALQSTQCMWEAAHASPSPAHHAGTTRALLAATNAPT